METLFITTPRAESSLSNWVTAGFLSPVHGTTTAHSKFSRNSLVLMRQRCRSGGGSAPI